MATFPDGTLLRAKGTDPIFVIQSGQRRWIPDMQTFQFDGYNLGAIQDLDTSTVNAIPRGPDMPKYQYMIAEGTHWSAQGGHEIYAHCDLNLETGDVHGYTVTTNYVQFAGYHSGSFPIFWNSVGDPIGPVGPMNRFVGEARFFGPPTSTGPKPWPAMSIGGLASQVMNLTVAVGDAPDNLDQVLSKVGKIASTGNQILTFSSEVVKLGGAIFTGKPK